MIIDTLPHGQGTILTFAFSSIGKVDKDSDNTKAHVMTKKERRNQANQVKYNKAVEVAVNRKLFAGTHGAPKIVAVVPLSPSINPIGVVNAITGALDVKNPVIQNPGVSTVYSDKFKQKLTYILPPRNFISILDAAKVADFVVFILSATEEVDEFGELCIRAIESQGVSNTFGIIPDIKSVPNAKQQNDVRESLFSFFTHFFPTTDKMYATEIPSETLNIARILCQKYPKGVHWRDERPYLLADQIYWEADNSAEQKGYAVVEGYVRGKGFNPDRLVHIPGYGDFQVAKIVKAPSRGANAMETDESLDVLPTENRETLDDLVPFDDDMMVEDEGYNGEFSAPGVRLDDHHYFRDEFREEYELEMKTRRLPKGMSDYQSKWIIDDELIDDEELSEDDFEDEEEMVDDNGEDDFGVSKTAPSEYGDMTEAGDMQSEMFLELSADEEERQLKEYRARARADLEFPDEVELPPNVSAKERMSRYRGLKNLRSCTWDVEEKDPRAPEEWARLLRVQNFRATKNRVLKDAIINAKVEVGTKVKLYIVVDRFIADNIKVDQTAFTIYGLLEHEHKQGVVNYSVNPNTEYNEPIASKETLIAQCGARRYLIRPIFSQAGKSSNNVYKYERFLQPGRQSTASFIAPVTFGNVPVLYFKQNEDRLDLIGSGSVLDADHSRILAKRAILTGAPFKIHKKLVTIRYIFFNREDILWYKAVPLFTKTGRSGFIKEALGTHGYFKATFDKKISAQDVIAMALYKRVWPRTSMLWNGGL